MCDGSLRLKESVAVGIGANKPWCRGYVSSAHPSDTFPLQWPALEGAEVGAPQRVQLGLSLEPLGAHAAMLTLDYSCWLDVGNVSQQYEWCCHPIIC